MPRSDDTREIADAAFLFDNGPTPSAPKDRSEDDDRAPLTEAPESNQESYDLAERASPGRPRRRPPSVNPEGVPEIERSDAGVNRPSELTPAPVLQPWNRLAEWGPTLGRITIALIVLVGLVYWSFSAEHLMRSLALLGVGMGVVILLSYPIAITLERPVRMTPEHAVRDYYGALAHHLPHRRRMWLLLSSAGRSAPEFSSYATFLAYWKETIRSLKRNGAGGFTPLFVRIDEFKSDKSAGQEAVKASYRISFFLRGREDQKPLYSSWVETTLSRGPDRMWYLDEGRLPPG
ncbi:hypothetical protein [Tautonia rosea]|uniref:hypothetical protein n=1 Tax=Tautonia rosea TaxID=2728037 RepID=UPI0014737998|nr:hypothetical protein [Tautonia rosea]